MSVTELPSPPTDVVSSARFSPDGLTLLVGAWDNSIYIYKSSSPSEPFSLHSAIAAEAPILDIAWNSNGTDFYAVGLDQDVAQYNVDVGATSRKVLSSHDSGACKVRYSAQHNLVLSIAWDETMHVHNLSTGTFTRTEAHGKPVALALNQEYAVVTLVDRKVYVYDLATLASQAADSNLSNSTSVVWNGPVQLRESSLKFMTRDVACMPDGKGFVCSSIEGRVGVEWFDKEANKNMYAFKCHREKTTTTSPETGETVPLDVVYPVNAVAFHPIHTGSFATGGGDGVVALWDANTKRRIRQYAKLPASVTSLEFSADGRYLAVGVSPGFEDGRETEEPDAALIKVVVRELKDNEAQGKAAKEKA
jgi:cell cycle arrest protein BUB3